MRVLVVDDDEDQLTVRCMLISHHGFEVVRAGDADSARSVASKGADVAVIDIHLPTREIGLKLLRDLRASNPGIHLIVMTGTDPANLQHHPEMRLADDIFVKGSCAKMLLSCLQRIAERRVA